MSLEGNTTNARMGCPNQFVALSWQLAGWQRKLIGNGTTLGGAREPLVGAGRSIVDLHINTSQLNSRQIHLWQINNLL
jgi:hypothetical protein